MPKASASLPRTSSTSSALPIVGRLSVRAFDPPKGRDYDATAYPGRGIYQHSNGALVFCDGGRVKMMVGAVALMETRS